MVKRSLFLLVILLPLFGSSYAQVDETIVVINGENISKEEFLHFYNKNNDILASNKVEKLTAKAYIDLFINYKLKVLEAKRLQLDTLASFQKELNSYKEELLQPHLSYNTVTEDQVKAVYERVKKEINASHILFAISPNATAYEIDSVRQKSLMVRKEILDGKRFTQAALEYSQDPSARTNGGNLGYFTAFQMVAPFENIAYQTKIGDVSMPVRTKFGYHLIKVNDIRENRGMIQVAHIMKKFPPNMSAQQKELLKKEIDSIYQLLLDRADFEMVADSYSDDKESARKGGVLPPFYAHQMPEQFAEAAFSIKRNGQVIKPIETKFGYHIIKKIKSIPIPTYEELRDKIAKRLKNNPNLLEANRRTFINDLKELNNYQESEKNVQQVIDKKSFENNLTLFRYDGKIFNSDQFRTYLQKNHLKQVTLNTYNKWVDDELISLKKKELLSSNEKIKNTINEYHDGILLFNVMQLKVWNQASQDSVGLEEFYKNNRDKYFWENRFKGLLITCNSKKTCKRVKRDLKREKTVQQLQDKYNNKEKKITIAKGVWSEGDNTIIDKFVYGKEINRQFLDPKKIIVHGKIVKQEPKTLDEARGAYISDYQDYLEQQWIKELRERYQITVNKAVVNSI